LETTALRNGTLHLSYGSFNYPFFFPQATVFKKNVGFLTEVWKVFTPKLVYEQYSYEHSSSPVCDGILLPVQTGLAITNAGAYTPNYLRSQLFRQSTAAYYTAFNFYEADRTAEQQSTEFAHLLGSFLHFLVESIREINDENLVQRNPLVSVTRSISHIVLAIGMTLTVYYHAAGFKGNNVMYSNPVQTSFSTLVAGLHDGSRLLMTKSANTFSKDQLYALVGNRTSRSDVAEPDQTMLIQRLCDDHRLVAMVEPNAVYSMSLVKRPCELNKVPIPQPWKYLENFDRQILQTYMMSRNDTSRSSVKAVNQVLLRVFPQEMIETFWTNRYLSSFKNKPSRLGKPTGIKEDGTPLSLTRLQPLFYFTVPGWLLSIFVFILELLSRFTTPLMRFLHYPNLI
ncbi:hypothetical protein PMAYCL1PPCAC_12962, partial [Pristionchus mayeri]